MRKSPIATAEPISVRISPRFGLSHGTQSPAIDVCKTLLRERAALSVFDPRVSKEAISVSLTADDGSEKALRLRGGE